MNEACELTGCIDGGNPVPVRVLFVIDPSIGTENGNGPVGLCDLPRTISKSKQASVACFSGKSVAVGNWCELAQHSGGAVNVHGATGGN